MRRSNRTVLFLFASILACVAASNPAWQTKNFNEWTNNDAKALLTDSPWAKPLPMPASGRPTVMVMEAGTNVTSPPAAALGNGSNATTGANMSMPSVGGSNGPADPGPHNLPTTPTPSGISRNPGAPAPPTQLTIIWASATPIRLAVLKLRLGENAPAEEAQIAHAAEPRPNYVIAVVGLPAPDGEFDPKALAQDAYLQTAAKPPLHAANSDYRKIGNSDVYFFHFPRAAFPLTAADGSVEFKMRMGKSEIKKRFELAQMQYKGQLAL